MLEFSSLVLRPPFPYLLPVEKQKVKLLQRLWDDVSDEILSTAANCTKTASKKPAKDA